MSRRKPIPSLALPQEYRYDPMTGVEEYRTREGGVWSPWTIWEEDEPTPDTEDQPMAVTREIAQREMERAWADEIFGEDDRSPMWVPPPNHRDKIELDHLAAEVINVLSAADQLPADMVELPPHYARFKIEPIRFCIENNLNGFQFNIVKYIMRWDAKDGLQDLKKAQRYLTMFIKWVEGDVDWWRKAA